MPDYDILMKKCKEDAAEALKKEPLDYKDLVNIYQYYIDVETMYLENHLGKDDRQASRYAIYRGIYLGNKIDRLENEYSNARYLFTGNPEKEREALDKFQKNVKKQLNAIVDGSIFTDLTKYCLEAEHMGLRAPTDKKIKPYYDDPISNEPEGLNFNLFKEDIIAGMPKRLYNPVILGTTPLEKEIIYHQHKLTRESLEMISGMISKLNQGKEGVYNGSGEYDNIITAATTLERATKELYRRQEYGGSVSQSDYDTFLDYENNLSNSINVYLNKKEREYRENGNRHRNDNSEMRVGLVKSIAADFEKLRDKNIELHADKHFYQLRRQNIASLKSADTDDKLKNILIKDYYYRLLETDYGHRKGDSLGVKNGANKLLREKISPTVLEYGFEKFKAELNINHKDVIDSIDDYIPTLKNEMPTLTRTDLDNQLKYYVPVKENMHLNLLSDVKDLDMPYITENQAKIMESAAMAEDSATPKKDYMLEIVTKLKAATKGVWGGTKEFDTLIEEADKIRLAERGINYNSKLSDPEKAAAATIFDKKKVLLEKMQNYVVRKYGEKMDAEAGRNREKTNSKMRRETVENMINLLTENMQDTCNNYLQEKMVPDDALYKTKLLMFDKKALVGHPNFRETIVNTKNLNAFDLAKSGPNFIMEFETLLGEEINLANSLLLRGDTIASRADAYFESKENQDRVLSELPPYSQSATMVIDKILRDYEMYTDMCPDYTPTNQLRNKLKILRKTIETNGMPDFILGGDIDGSDILERFDRVVLPENANENIFDAELNNFTDDKKFTENEDIDIPFDVPLGNDFEFEENPGLGVVDYLKNDDEVADTEYKSESEDVFNPDDFANRENVGTSGRVVNNTEKDNNDNAVKEENKDGMINLAGPVDENDFMDNGDNIININEHDEYENINLVEDENVEIKDDVFKKKDDDGIKIDNYRSDDPEDDLDLKEMTEAIPEKKDNRDLTVNDLDKILKGIETVAQNKLEETLADEASPYQRSYGFKDVTNCIYRTMFINDLKNNPDFVSGKIKMNVDQLKQEMDDFVSDMRKTRYNNTLNDALHDMYNEHVEFIHSFDRYGESDYDQYLFRERRKLHDTDDKTMTTKHMLELGQYAGGRMIQEVAYAFKKDDKLATKCITKIPGTIKEAQTNANNMEIIADNIRDDLDAISFIMKASKKGILKKIGVQHIYNKNEDALYNIATKAKNTIEELDEKCVDMNNKIFQYNAHVRANNKNKNVMKKK